MQVNKWAAEADSGVVWARYLKQLMKYALLHSVITTNPFDAITIPTKKKKVKKQENFLSSEQLNRFLDYWEEYGSLKQYTYFRLLAYSGMRRGEILALNLDNIDFSKKHSISINQLEMTTVMDPLKCI